MAQWKLISGYIYVVLFEVFGLLYALSMTSVVLFQYSLLGSAGGFVDKMFTFLALAQVVIGFFVHNDYPDLKFTITLDSEEDGQNVTVNTKDFNIVFFVSL
jgi:hypothetical protein